jgi:hypothetical protein
MMSVVISDGKSRIELRKLTPRQLKRLDVLLEQVGEFGAVKLVVEKGVVKFVEVTVSNRI